MSSSSIPDFYKNRSILVTGFTGFLGKVIVEKLLRSCPDLDAIYVLVRSLKGKTTQERVGKILDSALFESIKRDNPENLKKIIPINGDIMDENLALSPEDMQILINNVTVVFHSAATVKFDEDLRFAMQLNVLGTKRLLHLCHKMKNFAVFVHASTAFANLDQKKIYEKVYTPPVKPEKLAASLEWMDDETAQTLSRQLLTQHHRPNTYTFTKTLAEQLMVDEASHFPIIIVRPSVITASLQEPTPGWIDNLNGATGIVAAIYKGLLKRAIFHEEITADIIPVDIVSNAMIAAGWQRAQTKDNSVPVLHVTSGQMNPLKLEHFVEYTNKITKQFPLLKPFRTPHLITTRIPLLYEINHVLWHLIPAHFADMVTKVAGGRPILVKVMSRMKYAMDTMQFFLLNDWYFASKNIVDLRGQMSEEDRKKFNIDVSGVNWDNYIDNLVLGIRKHVLMDELSTLPQARKKAFRYNTMIGLLKTVMFVLALRFLNKKTQIIRRLWQLFLNNATPLLRLLPAARKAILA